jgi:outer membrane lipoprotein SlyB
MAGDAAPNSVVTLIEVMPMPSGSSSTGTVAGAAVGGTGSPASDRVYRITLHMDDGSTRVVTQEAAPTFKAGDRVRMSGNSIQR